MEGEIIKPFEFLKRIYVNFQAESVLNPLKLHDASKQRIASLKDSLIS